MDSRLTPRGMPFPSVFLILIALIVTVVAGCGPGATESGFDDLISCQQNRIEQLARESRLSTSDRYIVKLSSEGEAPASTAVKSSDASTGDDAGAEYVRELFSRAAATKTGSGYSEPEVEVDAIDGDTYSVRLDVEQDAEGTVEMIGAEPGVEYVEPDYKVYSLESVEEGNAEALDSASSLTDPLTSRQWAHKKIGSFGAWQVTPGDKRIVVAVIDTGVDYNHPDLKANMWRNPGEIPGNGRDDDDNGFVDDVYGWDFANDDNKPLSNDGKSFHGTHVAGTIGAVGGNKVGITGHSPNVRIMALKFLGANGGFTSDAVRAVNYAIAKGARIMNNSWGSGNASRALQDAIERARKAGILFVAAAGNSGNSIKSRPMYPAAYSHDNILVVGATDQNDKMPSWSNYSTTRVDVGAPGKGIYSTKNDGKYASLNGTSMATPLVSGVAALISSIRPDFGYGRLKATIMGTVDKTPSLADRVLSGGRVNAQRAIASAASGNTPPVSIGGGSDIPFDPCAGLE